MKGYGTIIAKVVSGLATLVIISLLLSSLVFTISQKGLLSLPSLFQIGLIVCVAAFGFFGARGRLFGNSWYEMLPQEKEDARPRLDLPPVLWRRRPIGIYMFFFVVFLWQLLLSIALKNEGGLLYIFFGALPAMALSFPWNIGVIGIWAYIFDIDINDTQQGRESGKIFLQISLFVGMAINAFLLATLLKWWRGRKIRKGPWE